MPAITPSRRHPLLLAVVAATLLSCGGASPPASSGDEEPSFSPAAEIPDDAHTLRVRAGDFFFDPVGPTVPAGRPIALTLQNFGQVEHDWLAVTGEDEHPIVDAYVYVDRGQTATGVFTLEAGTYVVLCTIPGHREAGMVGTITAG